MLLSFKLLAALSIILLLLCSLAPFPFGDDVSRVRGAATSGLATLEGISDLTLADSALAANITSFQDDVSGMRGAATSGLETLEGISDLTLADSALAANITSSRRLALSNPGCSGATYRLFVAAIVAFTGFNSIMPGLNQRTIVRQRTGINMQTDLQGNGDI